MCDESHGIEKKETVNQGHPTLGLAWVHSSALLMAQSLPLLKSQNLRVAWEDFLALSSRVSCSPCINEE